MLTAGSSDYVLTLPVTADFDIEPANINWALLIQDMRDIGFPMTQQADSVDVPWSTLQRWWQGSEPAFHSGFSLLILHSKTCGITLTHQRLRESCP